MKKFMLVPNFETGLTLRQLNADGSKTDLLTHLHGGDYTTMLLNNCIKLGEFAEARELTNIEWADQKADRVEKEALRLFTVCGYADAEKRAKLAKAQYISVEKKRAKAQYTLDTVNAK